MLRGLHSIAGQAWPGSECSRHGCSRSVAIYTLERYTFCLGAESLTSSPYGWGSVETLTVVNYYSDDKTTHAGVTADRFMFVVVVSFGLNHLLQEDGQQ